MSDSDPFIAALSSRFETVTGGGGIPHPEEIPGRLFSLERTVLELVRDRKAERRARWALILALVGVIGGGFGTAAVAGGAAAVAYGELRQTARQNAESIADMRSELRALRLTLDDR